MTFWKWSQTANTNASADSTINWAEGQAPSSINDSARGMMAASAKYRDDIAGAIVTAGASTAYTVTSYQIFDTLAHLNGQMIAFSPHATNTNTVGNDATLNVDGLGAKPIRIQPSIALPGGTLILGTPYIVVYNNSDAVFYLRNMTNPYSIPVGGSIDFWGSTAPNSSFAFPFGQAISRTTYSVLYGLVGGAYGTGDGSTTFNIPDLRGRVLAGRDDMGGSAASRLTNTYAGFSGAVLGNAGGGESHTLTTAEMPVHSHGVTDPTHTHSVTSSGWYGSTNGATSGGSQSSPTITVLMSGVTLSAASTGISINNAGSGSAHAIVQPTIICNYILRII